MSKPNLISYIIGFISSIVLTYIAFILVQRQLLDGSLLIVTIFTLAVAQAIIQLFFFLHIGNEPNPKFNLMAFSFTVGTVLIIVLASIWIMNHLNYNHNDVDNYIKQQEGIYK